MTLGKISPRTLTDIANAIRYQNGTNTLYKPRQMAAAVSALDGNNAGSASEENYRSYPPDTVTVVSDAYLEDIADAIRGQNGLSVEYLPSEMAQAIRDLEWDVGLKPRAVLLSNGTLEFNYFDRRRAASSGTVVTAFEVTPSGYASAMARPWDSIKTDVTRVVIDSSFASVGVTSCAYWFSGFTNLVEVWGLESVSGITNATQMFTSCPALESIYATSFDNSSITSSLSMFYGCIHLVGGTDGFVPASTSNASVCKLGSGGVLTNPAADMREWFNVYLYYGVIIEFTAGNPEISPQAMIASGRLCANAKYNAAGIIPGYELRDQFRQVIFRESMGSFAEVNMNYWFYGLGAIEMFSLLGNLANVRQMRYAFTSCNVTELDFRGFDPSHLTDLFYTFGGCQYLTTILADSTWVLPSSGISGTQTFYNCKALIGGNGTTYASNRTSYAYMRIDKSTSQGYLTAG